MSRSTRMTGLAALAVLAVAPTAAQADAGSTESAAALTAKVRSAAAWNAAGLQPTVDHYRADLGGINNGGNPPAASGRREINWDAVPAAVSSPAPLPLNAFQARGAIFATPGTSVQVSQNAGEGPVRFDNLAAGSSSRFGTFSPQKLFTPVGSNVVDVRFTKPGTTTPATTNGFGAVFTDVDIPGSKITYYDKWNTPLGSWAVPPKPGSKTLSFLGVTFSERKVARVRITSGTHRIGTWETWSRDVAVMDDFVYGEPRL